MTLLRPSSAPHSPGRLVSQSKWTDMPPGRFSLRPLTRRNRQRVLASLERSKRDRRSRDRRARARDALSRFWNVSICGMEKRRSRCNAICEAELAPFRALEGALLAVGLAGLLLSVLAVSGIASSLSRPVLRLAEDARRVEAGDYTPQPSGELDRRDELGQLVALFSST